MTARAWSAWSAALAALVSFAALDLLIAYRSGVVFGVATLIVVVVLALVMQRPVTGIYLALLVIPLEYLSLRVGGNAGLSPTEGVLLLTAGAVAVRAGLLREEEQISAVHVLFGLFILVTLLGVTYAVDTIAVFKIVVIWTALLLCSIHVASRDRETLERVLICLAIAGGIVGIVAMATSGQQQLLAGGSLATGRAQASFQQPNVLAFFLAAAFPVALMLASRGRALLRVVMLAAALAAIGGLLLTLSREGMIGAFVAVLVLLAWPPFRRWLFSLLGVLVLVAALNLGTLTDQRGDAAIAGSRLSIVSERLATLTQGKTVGADPRVRIWSAAPDMIADRPLFGVGAANYAVWSPDYGVLEGTGVAYDHAHDILLTVAIEEGLIGAVVWVLFLFAIAAAGRRALRRRGEDFPLALAVVAALVAEFAMGIVDYPLRTNAIMGVLMVLVGALVAFDRLGAPGQAPAPTPPEPSGPPRIRVAAPASA